MSWVCRELCLRPPIVLSGAYAVDEAREFALAARSLAAQPRLASSLVNAVAVRDPRSYGAIVGRLGLEAYCLQVCSWVGSLVCSEFCICVCPNPGVQPPEWTNIGYILVDSDIDGTGKTTVARSGAGGVGYAFLGSLQLKGFCATTSSITPGAAMMYRFLYSVNGGATLPVVDGHLDPNPFQVAGLPTQFWPGQDASHNATSASVLTPGGAVFVCNHVDVPFSATSSPAVRPPPAVGTPWYPPSVYVWPDPTTGWTAVYPDAYGGNYNAFMDLASGTLVPGTDPNAGFLASDIGQPVPSGAVLDGSNVVFTFEATRTSNPASPDYQQAPRLVRVNNNIEVNQLTLAEFESGPDGCCTPITTQVNILVSVDHEEMGPWSLGISSCGLPADVDLWPAISTPAGVTIVPRGGYGTFTQDTSSYPDCSYTVTLTTTPLMTDGVNNRSAYVHRTTFCICGG
jgi:hypothetical protein